MNENLNLVTILKDCPKGTKLYSPAYGYVSLFSIKKDLYPIHVTDCDGFTHSFSSEGRLCINKPLSECLLFPSKDQRDWSKFNKPIKRFDVNTLKPFDRVLVRDSTEVWDISLFGYINIDEKRVRCVNGTGWYRCIPYNDETKDLLGSLKDCPEYYKWWE